MASRDPKIWARTSELKAGVLKALACPARIRILELLKDGSQSVSWIIDEIGLEQSNVSQHLTILRKRGIVIAQREGLRVNYSIASPEVFSILEDVETIVRKQYENDQVLIAKKQTTS